MPSFIINYEGSETQIDVTGDTTIGDLKEKINKELLDRKNVYLDLEITLDRPIRSLGKFNVDIGIIPRTMDRYPLNRFAIEDKIIPCTIHLVDKKEVKLIHKPERTRKTSGIYVPKFLTPEKVEEPTFDITNMDDFPSL
jgi:hypothetical protein